MSSQIKKKKNYLLLEMKNWIISVESTNSKPSINTDDDNN
jgi:hypothetical protein